MAGHTILVVVFFLNCILELWLILAEFVVVAQRSRSALPCRACFPYSVATLTIRVVCGGTEWTDE